MNGAFSLSELYVQPEFQDLQRENEFLRTELSSEQLAKVAMKNVEDLKLPFILKNKLVMNEGIHNGLLYTKTELLDDLKFSDQKEFNLICDHLDTRQGAGVANYAGLVMNRHWQDTGPQGPGIYGDLSVMSETLAKQLALGAKFGVSPTYDYDSVELEGQSVATNLSTVSYSLVLDPAVRKTMLNSNNGGGKMPEELAKKKYPYKYPYQGKGKAGGKYPELDFKSEIEVDEATLAILEEMEKKIKELQEFKNNVEKAELEARAENIVLNELIMGRIDEGELDSRREILLGKSIEVLEEVENVVGSQVDLSAWTNYLKQYKKKNPKASFKEIAAAYKKEKGSMDASHEENLAETPENELSQLVKNSQSAPKKHSELMQDVTDKNRSELDYRFAETLFGRGLVSGGAK